MRKLLLTLVLLVASASFANALVNINIDYNDLATDNIIDLQPRTNYTLTFTNLPVGTTGTRLLKQFRKKVFVKKKFKNANGSTTIHRIKTRRARGGFEGTVNFEVYNSGIIDNGNNNGDDMSMNGDEMAMNNGDEMTSNGDQMSMSNGDEMAMSNGDSMNGSSLVLPSSITTTSTSSNSRRRITGNLAETLELIFRINNSPITGF